MTRIRYQLDEHVAHDVETAVRKHEIDVVTAAEVGLLGRPDTEVLAYAHIASRVIITNDADYLELSVSSEPPSGIVYWDQEIRSIGELIETLVLIHGVYSPEDMVGRVEYVFAS